MRIAVSFLLCGTIYVTLALDNRIVDSSTPRAARLRRFIFNHRYADSEAKPFKQTYE